MGNPLHAADVGDEAAGRNSRFQGGADEGGHRADRDGEDDEVCVANGFREVACDTGNAEVGCGFDGFLVARPAG